MKNLLKISVLLVLSCVYFQKTQAIKVHIINGTSYEQANFAIYLTENTYHKLNYNHKGCWGDSFKIKPARYYVLAAIYSNLNNLKIVNYFNAVINLKNDDEIKIDMKEETISFFNKFGEMQKRKKIK